MISPKKWPFGVGTGNACDRTLNLPFKSDEAMDEAAQSQITNKISIFSSHLPIAETTGASQSQLACFCTCICESTSGSTAVLGELLSCGDVYMTEMP